MKFSIFHVLALTTIAGLGIALYIEHSKNEQSESKLRQQNAELRQDYEQQLQDLEEGLTIRLNISNLIRSYEFSQNPSVRQDFEYGALVHIVNAFKYSEFLNDGQPDDGNSNDEPALVLAAKLLSIADCSSPEAFFAKLRKMIEELGMAERPKRLTQERMYLGPDQLEQRKELTLFVQRALSK